MSIQSMGFPIFTDGIEDSAAAKITAVEPFRHISSPGALTLTFGEIGKQTIASGEWARGKNPQVGDWYVCPEGGGAGVMSDDEFQAKFRLKL